MPLAPARPSCTRAGQTASPRPRLAGNPTTRQPRRRPPRPSGPARRSRGARGAGRGPLRELLGLVVRPRPRRPAPSLPPPPGPTLCPGPGHPGQRASSLCLRPTSPRLPGMIPPFTHVPLSAPSPTLVLTPSVSLSVHLYISLLFCPLLSVSFCLHPLKKKSFDLVCICAVLLMGKEVGGQLAGVDSLLPPYRSQGWNHG